MQVGTRIRIRASGKTGTVRELKQPQPGGPSTPYVHLDGEPAHHVHPYDPLYLDMLPDRPLLSDSKTYDAATSYAYAWAESPDVLFRVVVVRDAEKQPLAMGSAIRAERRIAEQWDLHPAPLWYVTIRGTVQSHDGAYELQA